MEKKRRYVLKNKTTGKIEIKIYFIEQIEKGLHKLFDIENYDIISRDLFTGKQDKYCKDIYECDIWERDGFIGIVLFKYSTWIFEKAPSSKFYQYPSFYSNAKYGILIGDIHKNPELLGDKY